MADDKRSRALAHLLADLDQFQGDMERREALAWLVVCVDHDAINSGSPNCIVGCYGPFASPEEALVEAGRHDASSLKNRDYGDPGWSHLIRPLYGPIEWKDGS